MQSKWPYYRLKALTRAASKYSCALQGIGQQLVTWHVDVPAFWKGHGWNCTTETQSLTLVSALYKQNATNTFGAGCVIDEFLIFLGKRMNALADWQSSGQGESLISVGLNLFLSSYRALDLLSCIVLLWCVRLLLNIIFCVLQKKKVIQVRCIWFVALN